MKFFEALVLAVCCFYLGSTGNVEILGSHSAAPFSQDWVVENVYDNDDNKCFCTQPTGNDAVAYVEIVLAEVNQIRLLNRDFMPERLENVRIEVCEGNNCKLCGMVPATGSAAWVTIDCAGSPLRGNRIFFRSTHDHALSFCELKIEGITIATPVEVMGATASKAFNNDWTVFEGYESDPNKCYSSADFNAEAILDIPESRVSQVALLNRFDDSFAYRLGGIVVQVCRKGGECLACNTIPETRVSQWGVAACVDGPVLGNQIKLIRPNECLTFCDTQIFAVPDIPEPECICQDYHWACQGVDNRQFVADHQSQLASAQLANPTCANDFFQLRCPRSCAKCSC